MFSRTYLKSFLLKALLTENKNLMMRISESYKLCCINKQSFIETSLHKRI